MAEQQAVVAFLGPTASYTHQAALAHFPHARLVPQTTIEDVFAAVQSDAAITGVVPFENSTNGPVAFTLDLLANLNPRYPDLQVCAEAYVAVQHCLLGHVRPNPQPPPAARLLPRPADPPFPDDSSGRATPTPSAPRPGTPRVRPRHDLSHIRKVYSHPQAWGQCKLFLSAYLKAAEQQDVSSTSKAAELVAEDPTGTTAAVASRVAAGMFGLRVLGEGIEDREGNTTRFFVLRRRRRGGHGLAVADGLEGGGAAKPETEREPSSYKTLVCFTVSHSAPGALAESLAVFKRFDLNLTSISTRPSGEAAWHYIFFVEYMGRKREDALQALGEVATSYRWLGSWRDVARP